MSAYEKMAFTVPGMLAEAQKTSPLALGVIRKKTSEVHGSASSYTLSVRWEPRTQTFDFGIERLGGRKTLCVVNPNVLLMALSEAEIDRMIVELLAINDADMAQLMEDPAHKGRAKMLRDISSQPHAKSLIFHREGADCDSVTW